LSRICEKITGSNAWFCNIKLNRIGLVACFVLVLWTGFALGNSVQEYQIKAAFLYNAAKFIEWPPESGTSGSFVIGVLGEDPFGSLLDDLSSKTIKGKKIIIKRFSSLDKVRECHMLFIPATERRRLSVVLSTSRDHAVLTVSDLDGFAKSGGMIELAMDKGRLGFDVNNHQIRKQGLKISAQMLKLARTVQD
jgi:YfiR/HmsC-like